LCRGDFADLGRRHPIHHPIRAELDEDIAIVHAENCAAAILPTSAAATRSTTRSATRSTAARRTSLLEIFDRHTAKSGFDLSLEFGVISACARSGNGLVVICWFIGHDGSQVAQRTALECT